MAQIEVPKSVAYSLIGPPASSVAASKIVAYVVLVPGNEDTAPSGAGYVYSNITHRLRR